MSQRLKFIFLVRGPGDYHADSDWDVLIIVPEEKITFDYEIELREPIFNLEIETGEVISLMIYSKSDWQNKKAISPLFSNVAKGGLKI